MTIHQMSVLAWIGGGVVGSALSTEHRVLGFILGAVVVGAVADKVIERRYYPPGSPAREQLDRESEMWLAVWRA